VIARKLGLSCECMTEPVISPMTGPIIRASPKFSLVLREMIFSSAQIKSGAKRETRCQPSRFPDVGINKVRVQSPYSQYVVMPIVDRTQVDARIVSNKPDENGEKKAFHAN